MSRPWVARSALLSDRPSLAHLMSHAVLVHRHLDWREPLEWLGQSPFLLLESENTPHAALACPPDPAGVAWLRLFACDRAFPIEEAWFALWEDSQPLLRRAQVAIAAAIVLHPALSPLLEGASFSIKQEIVLLDCEHPQPVQLPARREWTIRPMLLHDLPAVAAVDAQAFEPLWQTSLETLGWAYRLAAIATVAEQEGEILGYQISTRSAFSMHLARLAVLPERQGQGIGTALALDMMQRAQQAGIYRFTVNTQHDNASSLALYRHLGFRETGERYPVYQRLFG